LRDAKIMLMKATHARGRHVYQQVDAAAGRRAPSRHIARNTRPITYIPASFITIPFRNLI